MAIGKFAQTSESFKILWPWLSAKFPFPHFLSLLTTPIVEKIHIFAGIYFIFLKNALHQTWKFFSTKYGPQSEDIVIKIVVIK